MKKTLLIIGAILLVAVIAGGSFYAGMTYKTNQVNQVQQKFFNERGQPGQRQFPGGTPPAGASEQIPGGGMGFPGGGAFGVIKAIDGDVLTISTMQDEVATVKLSDSTLVEKTVAGTITDLQPGMQVSVRGEKDSDGNITAIQVSIINTNMAGAVPAPQTGTEP